MGILVVGSVGLDDVQTPAGCRTRTLGGACTYFAAAASFYERVHIVAVVGSDFPQEHLDYLRTRGVDLRGLQIAEGKTFYWSGCYGEDLDNCQTLDPQLNVFADFHPDIPEELRDVEYVFLANIDPDLQMDVLRQMRAPKLTALDSMNYWINRKRDALLRAISMVDMVILNAAEVRALMREPRLNRAAYALLDLGPKVLVIKKGEHGAMLVTRGQTPGESIFLTPAYPLDKVVDPTGAGDTFAAGVMGYLAKNGQMSIETLRRAVVHGTVIASFTVEDFSIDRLRTLSWPEIEARYAELKQLTYFEPLSDEQYIPLRKSLP